VFPSAVNTQVPATAATGTIPEVPLPRCSSRCPTPRRPTTNDKGYLHKRRAIYPRLRHIRTLSEYHSFEPIFLPIAFCFTTICSRQANVFTINPPFWGVHVSLDYCDTREKLNLRHGCCSKVNIKSLLDHLSALYLHYQLHATRWVWGHSYFSQKRKKKEKGNRSCYHVDPWDFDHTA
jgi:hypothetical protein